MTCKRCGESTRSIGELCATCTFMEAEPSKRSKQKIDVTSAELDLSQSGSIEVMAPEVPIELSI